jgi:hypothetical protein
MLKEAEEEKKAIRKKKIIEPRGTASREGRGSGERSLPRRCCSGPMRAPCRGRTAVLSAAHPKVAERANVSEHGEAMRSATGVGETDAAGSLGRSSKT